MNQFPAPRRPGGPAKLIFPGQPTQQASTPHPPWPTALQTPATLVAPTPTRAWLSSFLFPEATSGDLTHVLDDPPLYISGNNVPADGELLQKEKIGIIISLDFVEGERISISGDGTVSSNMTKFYQDLGISRYLCPFSADGSTQEDLISPAYAVLREVFKTAAANGTRILIHGKKGLNEEVALLAARLASSTGLSFEEVVLHLSTHKNVEINPNLASKICETLKLPIDKIVPIATPTPGKQ